MPFFRRKKTAHSIERLEGAVANRNRTLSERPLTLDDFARPDFHDDYTQPLPPKAAAQSAQDVDEVEVDLETVLEQLRQREALAQEADQARDLPDSPDRR